MKNSNICKLAIFSVILGVTPALAEQVIYPSKGQSAEQQKKDKDQCYSWAKKNTGVDPALLAEEATAPSSAPDAKRGKVARGAAAGAVVGGIAGDAGTGAAIGAGAGAVGRRRAEKQSQSAQQAGKADIQQQLGTFNKAQAACLEGKGYSVK